MDARQFNELKARLDRYADLERERISLQKAHDRIIQRQPRRVRVEAVAEEGRTIWFDLDSEPLLSWAVQSIDELIQRRIAWLKDQQGTL